MADDAPNSAGAVSIEVRPDGKTFEPQLKALVVSAASRVAADLAKALSDQIPRQLSDAIKQGVRDGGEQAKVEAAKSGQSAGAAFADAFRKTVSDRTGDAPVGPGKAPSTKGGAESGGAFADAFKRRVDAALKSLPDAKIGADATDVDRAVEEIKAELKSLVDQKIGVDISDEVAIAKIDDLKAQIDQLGADSASVEVKVNLAAAAAQLEAFKRIVGQQTDIPVGPDPATSTKQGAVSAGAFATGFKTQVEAALRSIPDVPVDVDSSPADRAIAAIRSDLAELSGKRIGIDITDTEAVATIDALRERLDVLATRSPSIRVTVDAGAASAELAAISGEADAVGASGAAASSGMGLLGSSIITLGPAALPVLAAVAAATAAIGPLAIGVGAGLGVTALGFHGIAAAVEAMGKEQDKASTSSGGLASKQFAEAAAADQVRSATAALANTRANATSQEIQSAEQVASAQRQLGQAEVAAKQAEDSLTQSRVTAAQAMQDLNNQVIDGADAQRQANIDLVNARNALNAANSAANAAPANAALALARQQAQLNFDEANQHITELGISQQRLVDQQAAANKAGVEGSQQVVAAKASEVQANDQVAQAQQAVADARRQQADQARQSAFAITQAEQGIVSAQRAQAQAAEGAATATAASTSAADQALAKLGPAGQRFAKFIFGLQGDVKKTQDIAEAGLLPGAQLAIENLLPVLPRVDGFIGKLSSSIGGLFVEGSHTFTDPFWLNFFHLLGDVAVPALEGAFHGAENLAIGAAGLFSAFLPLDKQVGSGLLAFTARIASAGQNLDHNGAFQGFLKFVETEGPVVVHTVEDITGATVHLVEALAPVGGFVLVAVKDLAQGIRDIPVPILTAAAIAFVAINGVLKLQAGYQAAVKLGSTLAGIAQTGWNAATSTYNFLLGRQPALLEAAATPAEALVAAQGEAVAATESLAAALIGLTTAITPTAAGVESLTLAEIELGVQMEAVDAATAAAALSNEALGASMTGAAAGAGELAAAQAASAEASAGAKTASSGFASFLGGPWGIAIGAATVLAGLFVAQHEAQKQKIQGLVTSLGQLDTAYKQIGTDGGAALDNLVAHDTKLQGLINDAAKFNLGNVAQAISGDAADQQKVLDNYDAEILALKELYNLRTGAPTQTTPQDFTKANLPVPKDFNDPGFIDANNEIKNHIDSLTADRSAIKKTIDANKDQAAAQGLVNDQLKTSLGLTLAATPEQIAIATAYQTLGDSAKTAAQKLDAVKTIEEGSRGAAAATADITEKQAADYDALTNSVKELTDAHDKHSHSLDINTAAGRQNNDAVAESAKDLVTAYNNNIANGDSIDVATGKYNTQRDALEKHTEKLGLNNAAVQKIVDTYGEIPTDPKLEISVSGVSDVLTQLEQLQIAQESLKYGIPVDEATKEFRNQRKKATQVFGGVATGGLIRGPGTKTSDDIPAWLSDMEYVQPAHAVDHYGVTAMEAIRSHAVPKELLQGFASGGLVQWPFPVDASVTKIPSLAAVKKVAEGKAAASAIKGLPADVTRWAGVGAHVLSMLQQPADALGALLRRVQFESGGNPRAENLYDINAINGTPSVGLVQVIRPTFDAHAGPYRNVGPFAYGVSEDPTANIYAGMNYAVGRYGSVKAIDPKVRPYGYDSGGYMPPGLSLSYNGTGKPEPVLTHDEGQSLLGRGGRGDGPLLSIDTFNGGDASAQEIAGELAWELRLAGV